MRTLLLLGFCLLTVHAYYKCTSDVFLRQAIKHREKDVELECNRENAKLRCADQRKVDRLWNNYLTAATEYKILVNECIGNRKEGRVRREAVSLIEPDLPVVRGKRDTCKAKATEEISKVIKEFKEYCESEIECTPEEDIPAGPKREKYYHAMNKRILRYNEYLVEVTACNI